MKNSSFIFLSIFSFSTLFSQTDSLSLKINKLEEVVLNSTRIDLPLSLNSRTIQVISATDIKN
jgi:vitamin B12 transporter